METTIAYSAKKISAQSISQSRWQRITLLSILCYEGLGGIAGGLFLTYAPDGHLMDMPISIMNGVFPDFFVPGIILLTLGVLNIISFVAVIRRWSFDWLWAGVAMGGYLYWFVYEIGILQGLHWLHIMWGLPVLIGFILALPMIPPVDEAARKMLLKCGIASSILYVAVNIIVPLFWEGYSMISQTPSELSAFNAPTRLLWILLCIPYSILTTAFAYGVLKSAGENKKLHTAGILLVIYGITGLLWMFAPMHLREDLAAGKGTWNDTMHLVLASVTEIIYLAALVLTASALGKSFRIYSIITVVALFFFGMLTFQQAPDVGKNLPTPTIGIWERINIGIFLLWVVVLAQTLINRKPASSSRP